MRSRPFSLDFRFGSSSSGVFGNGLLSMITVVGERPLPLEAIDEDVLVDASEVEVDNADECVE